MTLTQAFRTELVSLISDVKEKGTRPTSRGRNTNALIRVGLLHSSVEGSVMELELVP